MMQLKEVLKIKGGQPVTVPASATVADAIHAMSEHKVGSVIVPNADGSPAGHLYRTRCAEAVRRGPH